MRLKDLIAMGFDLSTQIPFTKQCDVRCSCCQASVINNVPCHETGCPNIRHFRECAWCGSEFVAETKFQKCCSEDCAEAYYG